MKTRHLLIWELFEVVLIAFIPMFITYQFLARPFLVQGASMEPNFQQGSYLMVDIISYKVGLPERGDVVVFRYPGDRSVYHIKRIIGLPGERVTFLDGEVFINGEVMNENHIPFYIQTTPLNQSDFSLSDNQYFVMGDNRAASFDSRSWGPLEKNDIVGAVRFKVWPALKFFRG